MVGSESLNNWLTSANVNPFLTVERQKSRQASRVLSPGRLLQATRGSFTGDVWVFPAGSVGLGPSRGRAYSVFQHKRAKGMYTTTAAYISGGIFGATRWPYGARAGRPLRRNLRGPWGILDRFTEPASVREALLSLRATRAASFSVHASLATRLSGSSGDESMLRASTAFTSRSLP